MNKVFLVGNRFAKMRNLSVVANCLVVFVFYFIYRYLLETSYPNFVGVPLVLIFLLICAGIVKLTLVITGKMRDNICYELTADSLVIGKGKTERRYKWTAFKSAELDDTKLRDILPAYFMVGEERLTLNQYVDEIYELAYQMIRRIESHATIDPELRKRADCMR